MRSTQPADSRTPILEVKDLSVDFDTGGATVHAVRGVSFGLGRGEILGIVGESGCGKSTLARALLRLIDSPGRITGGEILLEGRDLLTLPEAELRAVRGGAIGMVFQDPTKSLNPVFTIGEQIVAVIRAHQDVSVDSARTRAIELLADVGIPDPGTRVEQYPHELSGGMRQRATIAMALANQPAVIIADEATTALDVTIQAQILDLLRDINSRLGTSIAFISHNLGVIAELCHRTVVLYAGRIVESGSTDAVFRQPRHPYTRALLGSLPVPGSGAQRLTPVGGAPPVLSDLPPGCAFAPRCPHRMDRCDADPPSFAVPGGQTSACWLAEPAPAKPVAEVRR